MGALRRKGTAKRTRTSARAQTAPHPAHYAPLPQPRSTPAHTCRPNTGVVAYSACSSAPLWMASKMARVCLRLMRLPTPYLAGGTRERGYAGRGTWQPSGSGTAPGCIADDGTPQRAGRQAGTRGQQADGSEAA